MEDTFTSLIDGSFTNAISEAMRDNKINQKRPGIEKLTFLRFPALAKEFAVTFEYNNGDSASETGKADKVNPDGYLHMFLVKHAGSFWHCPEGGVDYKW